uniref:Uncharacterized protein n=1 Tax=Trypanosoma congolense (strain IL3000) TaxID=1068625 RepID=G0UKM1_TRYCI|nr:conserved hypothetical protein [Trypanosoma congolense IL3000]
MNSAAVTAENVLAHVSHLTPAEVSELLVRGTLATNTVSSPGAAVRFGQVTHGFKRAASYTKLHCLRWSAAGPATAPAACFPLVGDVMTCEYVNDKLRVVLKDEAVTYFAPQRDRNDLLDALLLVNYDNKTCNRRFQRIYSSWALYAQLLPYRERGGLSTNTQAMELFSKKLIMWLFSYFARESGTQIMLNQLEMAFPLLAGWQIQERRLFVEEAVSRFSAGIFSYYDDRVINRCRTPVNALSLLSLEELRSVTSTEQATAALMFNVQMQHNALLEALQLIIDCWGKQSPDLQLSLISHAVALLLSHVAETSSLRSSAGVRAWARVTAFRHITQLSSSPAEDTARRIVSLVRTQKQSKKSACTEIHEKLMELVLNGDMAHENGVSVPGAVLNDDESVFLDSTAPQQQSDTNVVWKIDRNSFCHWVVPSSQSLVKKDTSPTPNKVSAFLSSVVTAGPRFQLSRLLLKCAPAEGHLCLQLNLGAVSSENCGNTLWHSVRASKRGRTEN